MRRNYTLILFFTLIFGGTTWAQIQTPLDLALRHIEQQYAEWGYTANDIADLGVSSQHQSSLSGIQHLYLIQRVQGIEIYNAILNISIDANGQVVHTGKRLQADAINRVNTTSPVLTPAQAIQWAAAHLELEAPTMVLQEQKDEQTFVFEGSSLSRSDITVHLVFQPMPDQTIRLAWDLAIEEYPTTDYWSLRIDAVTGQVLNQNNFTIHCQFADNPYHNHDAHCRTSTGFQPVQEALAASSMNVVMDGTYRVFPLPAESPSHGDHTLIDNPADGVASPYGWHDTDGVDGAEYTHTRGNNVYAFPDLNANGSADLMVEGGTDLIFDFTYLSDEEPDQHIPASTTNLFYANNMMHDIFYHYGFDEEAGNFQDNNYGNGGSGGDGDAVNARGQYGGEDPVGNDASNNASFGTPGDGGSGTMTMFYWNTGASLLEITAPLNIAGFYPTGTADFGPQVEDAPASGMIVEVDDNVINPYSTDGCESPFANAAALAGNIALIDRGGCFFEEKAKNAEEAGAIAVIICNFEDGVIGMAGIDEPDPSIPTISIGAGDCALLRQYINDGLSANIAVANTGPEWLSADYDNGVIGHEYAHGISNRLTGGRFNSGCLSNAGTQDDPTGEQMGEGWSDFVAIATTVKPGDTGEMRRGVATYLRREPNEGKGLRAFPYSTDLDVNPVTYQDIVSATVPHGVGHVWCSMLWDLYWAMVDEYGFSDDLFNGDAGNNRAIMLVMEGMKMQPCDPGFVDGRDAILAADQALFNGDNQCLIWEVFARRGLGINADQGSTFSHTDGMQDFEPLPTCIAELKIKKSVTPFIEAGEAIEVSLLVINHKPEDLSGVLVVDEIPAGTELVAGSTSIPGTVDGNTISFEIGNMAYLDEITITYTLSSSEDLFSTRYFYEDVEASTIGVWVDQQIGTEAPNEWEISDLYAYSGDNSFFVESVPEESQQVLQNLFPQLVQGNQPVLRFWQRYDSQAGVDAGLVEISTDDGETWTDLGPLFFKNPYNGPVDYQTFVVPNLEGFSGNSGGWIDTYADLSPFAGEEVIVRFRYGTNESIAQLGWFLDDIEIMDLFNYTGEACVTADQGDEACAVAANRGTLVNSKLPSSVEELAKNSLPLNVFPNPAEDLINIQVGITQRSETTIQVIDLQGRILETINTVAEPHQTIVLSVPNWPTGAYFVQVTTEAGKATQKVFLR